MLALLLALSTPTVLAAEPPPKKNWFKRIRYAVGVGAQAGGGVHVNPGTGTAVFEPLAFEFRSYFTDQFAWHTTLNIGRMIGPAIERRVGRLDYDLHVGAHLRIAPRTEIVVAPGASIGYGFAGSVWQRFVGDVRFGFDVLDDSTKFAWSIYIRPYFGWQRTDPTDGSQPVAGITGGAVSEITFVYRIPKKWER